MVRIRLPKREWAYDPDRPLGKPGGFGAVFAGGSDTEPLAIKRLHLDAGQAAHREMRLALNLAERRLGYVMPILDAGEDAESGAYFVVMPRAEESLQDALDHGVTFPDAFTADILLQVASGLKEVEDIAHRDLKPANILRHDGVWKVADFGIAKFVEDSTSLATLKGCLSPPYAAPEQWQLESATAATDIYALGCLGYALLTGRPPFSGPDIGDYRQQHLFVAPAPLDQAGPRLRSLLSMMLRKAPESRPTLPRIQALLNQVKNEANEFPAPEGFQALVEANVRVAEAESEDVRRRREAEALSAARTKIYEQGSSILKEVMAELGRRIMEAAPSARLGSSREWSASLGQATLFMRQSPGVIAPGVFRQSYWDAVQGAAVRVSQTRPPYTWSALTLVCKTAQCS